MRGVRLGLTLACIATVVAGVCGPGAALAQSCDRACEARLRDARGCCPAPAPAPRSVSAASAPAGCQDGKEITPDTAGHCCWAGQVWTSGRCVGPPTSCPAPRTLDAKAQECVIPRCPAGMSRTDDKIHCCWPQQGWSVTRQTCVGNAQCPRGFEVEGEGCVSQDKDADGIPNAVDRCPDEPEDMNGFEDEDGCPDEPKRVAAAAAAASAAQQAAAEKDRQRVEAEAEKERQARAATQLQQERERAIEAQRKAREDDEARQKAEAAKAEQDRQDAIVHATTRRNFGLVLTGVGVAAGVGSVVFMALGSSENSTIKNGSLANGSAIASAASSGSTDNALAIGLGIVGLVGCGVGVPLFFSGLGGPTDKPAAAATVWLVPTSHGATVAATAHFE